MLWLHHKRWIALLIPVFAIGEIPILVTGGAGYIGTQTCKQLHHAGYFPIIYDNLSSGHKEAAKWGVLEIGDISDTQRLSAVIDQYHPVAVIHLAALKSVSESVKDPETYYLTNTMGSLLLLKTMREKGIDKFIFASTAAVYGEKEIAIQETDMLNPISPYGKSKAFVEKIAEDFDRAYGLRWIGFRYFNVAGADLELECGDQNPAPSNLIPITIEAAKKDSQMEVFGTDYPTRDGSAMRDFIHVADLSDAHIKALEYLLNGGQSRILNLGTGSGHCVKEIIQTTENVAGRTIRFLEKPRREGDAPFSVADASQAREILGWEPKYSDLSTIIQTEWLWKNQLAPYQNGQ